MFEQFSFRNFVPSNDLETYANARLSWISEFVPSYSSITADMEKSGVGYRLQLKIASPNESFSVEALANDAKTAIDRLEKRIGLSLSEWHKKRFKNAS